MLHAVVCSTMNNARVGARAKDNKSKAKDLKLLPIVIESTMLGRMTDREVQKLCTADCTLTPRSYFLCNFRVINWCNFHG